MSQPRLFAELFPDFVQRTCKLENEFYEDCPFFEAAVVWLRHQTRENPEDRALQERAKIIYVFAKLEGEDDSITHQLAPAFGAFLNDHVQFNGVFITPSFEGDVRVYSIEFPDTVRFCDDDEGVFWKSVIVIIFVEESVRVKIAMLYPDYDGDDELTGVFSLVKFEYDYDVDAATNIDRCIEAYQGDYLSYQVIEYSLKSLFYIESLGADLRIEKGRRHIDRRKVKTQPKSKYSIAHVGTNLEKVVQQTKVPPPLWKWVKDVDKGMPGFRLELG